MSSSRLPNKGRGQIEQTWIPAFAGTTDLRITEEGGQHLSGRLNIRGSKLNDLTILSSTLSYAGCAGLITRFHPSPTITEGSRDARLASYREVRDYLVARIRERFPLAKD